MNDDQREERVLGLVNAISDVVAGVELAEAHTALTLAVVVGIVTMIEPAERTIAAEAFSQQVRAYVARPDIIEWIEHSVISRHGSRGVQ
jgi:hypothetical protein